MNNNIKAGADIHAGDGGYSLGTEEKYNEFAKGRNQSLGKMRIVELLKQSGGIQYDEDGDELTPFLVGKDLVKFAELIVRECAEVAFKTDVSYTEIDTMHRIRDRIKDHFGVEE